MLFRIVQTLNIQWPEKVIGHLGNTINLTAVEKDIKQSEICKEIMLDISQSFPFLFFFCAIISKHYSLITCLYRFVAFSQTFLPHYGVCDTDIVFSVVESNNTGEFIAGVQPLFFRNFHSAADMVQ